LFDNTYQRYLIRVFRDRLPFPDVPIKLHLRHKHRDDQPPAEREEVKGPARKPPVDLTGLDFQTQVSDEEVKGSGDQYESELWKDL
jgi:GTP-binding protein